MTLALVLGALLAVACVVLVALPYLREPEAAEDALGPDEIDRPRLELAEARDRALAALKELEFDHRTGKVSDDDYRGLVGPLRREAAAALRALDSARGTPRRVSTAASGYGEAMEPLEPQVPTPVPEPYPPPDEGDPPGPAVVPEPEPQ